MLKYILVSFLACLAFSLPQFEEEYEPFPFDIFDPKWANYEYQLDKYSMKEITEMIRNSSDEPKIAQLADTLDQLAEVAANIDVEEAKKYIDPDAFRSICEIIEDKGYPCEHYETKVEDGFYLQMFRIPHGKNSTTVGPPVLLSHGLFDTSGTWIINTPEYSLGYLMADAGFDVWMGNIRGNKYGDTHEVHGRWSNELWAHSFDEHGTYDVADKLDFVFQYTNYSKIGIVGHSQGCAQLFSTMSQRSDVKDKITIFGALAPAGYMRYQKNIIILLASYLHLGELLALLGVKKAIPLPQFIIDIIPYICDAAPQAVEFLLSLIMGPNRGEWDYSRTSVMCANSLGFTSMQNLIHWAQLVRSKKFQYHDYGVWGNRQRYGSISPPRYDIKKEWPEDVPIAIWYGGNDDLCEKRDVESMISDFPRPPIYSKLIDRYSHEDFIWAVTAADEIYHDLVDIFKNQYREQGIYFN